jgi:hypothetical protein
MAGLVAVQLKQKRQKNIVATKLENEQEDDSKSTIAQNFQYQQTYSWSALEVITVCLLWVDFILIPHFYD